MTWREIHGDQNLRMASMMPDQQGQLNALNLKIAKIQAILDEHEGCPSAGCGGLDEIQDVINDAD